MSFVEGLPSMFAATSSFSLGSLQQNNSQSTSIRIVQCDFRIESPNVQFDITYSNLNKQQTFQVPVIRVFGPHGKTGQKCCAHIHGVLPYFYVALNPNIVATDDFVKTFATTCESVLRSSSRAEQRKAIKGHFIHNIELVAGVPMYGYYEHEHEFLKVYMYNPRHISWLADLLLKGVVMGSVFQPHESHVPFIMQFFMDFNLYGMNLIHFSDVQHRALDNDSVTGSCKNLISDQVPKVSSCELEFDTLSSFILNKKQVDVCTGSQKRLGNPGLRAIWQDELNRQRIRSGDEIVNIGNPDSPERTNVIESGSQEEMLSEVVEALIGYQMSQTLTPKSTSNIQFEDDEEVEFFTPLKVDFDVGKAKASSTPYANSTLQLFSQNVSTPGDRSVQFTLPSNGTVDRIANEQDYSVKNADNSQADTSFSCASLFNYIENDSQFQSLALNQSGFLKDLFDDEANNLEDVGDIPESDMVLIEAKLDECEDKNMSQILKYPEFDEDDETSFTQFDGKNRTVKFSEKNCLKKRKNSQTSADGMLMKPCVVKVSRLDEAIVEGFKQNERGSASLKFTYEVQRHDLSPKETEKDAKLTLDNNSITAVSPNVNSSCHVVNSEERGLCDDNVTQDTIFFSYGDGFQTPFKSDVRVLEEMSPIRSCGKYEVKIDQFQFNVANKSPVVLLKGASFVSGCAPKSVQLFPNIGSPNDSSLFERDVSITECSPSFSSGSRKRRSSESGAINNDGVVSDAKCRNDSIAPTPIPIFHHEHCSHDKNSHRTISNSVEEYNNVLGDCKKSCAQNNLCTQGLLEDDGYGIFLAETQSVSIPDINNAKNSANDSSPDNGGIEVNNYSPNIDRLYDLSQENNIPSVNGEGRNSIDCSFGSSLSSTATTKSMEKETTSKQNVVCDEQVLAGFEDSVELTSEVALNVNQNLSENSNFFESSLNEVAAERDDLLLNHSLDEFRHDVLSRDLRSSKDSSGFNCFNEESSHHSSELFKSPEDSTSEVTKLTFANLAPTKTYILQTLKKENLPEVNYNAIEVPVVELKPFHDENIDSFGEERHELPKRIILTPALPPPKIHLNVPWESAETLEIRLPDSTELKENDNDENSSDIEKRELRANSPSMFYSFMPPVFPSTADQLDPNAEDLQTQFGLKHSTTGVSIDRADITDSCNTDAIASSTKASQDHRYQYLTVMSMELHIITRGALLPNPLFDKIGAVFVSVFNDSDKCDNKQNSVAIIKTPQFSGSLRRLQQTCQNRGFELITCESELDIIFTFTEKVRELDPDILLGYEIQNSSWGYLLKRGKVLQIETIAETFSRTPAIENGSHFNKEYDEFGADEMSEINLAGRIVLNLWRIVKSELNLTSFTFQVAYEEVVKKRVPCFSYQSLTTWFNPYESIGNPRMFYKTIDHISTRCIGNLEIVNSLDLITRTSEMSRLFGMLFFEVLTRGSQYRVESMLLRSAKAQNFIAASPSIYQRAKMRAPEHIPLVLEPMSGFYADPVLVLDFQSLYPSMMIAYNYCFSTCLGRIEHLTNETNTIFQLGALSYFVPVSTLKKLIKKGKVHVAPNKVVYVDESVRKGLICQLVEDLLNTRIMVKRFMKKYKNDRALYKMLDARQLGLKLIANTTYGYTGANFSGRMPCVEVADSIVRKARETLEKSIEIVNNNESWNAEVIYGDTDSMFVRIPGASKETAFQIGKEISEVITNMNPKPVKLKFEKVYYPCVLITKKRYVGYSFETVDQQEPLFDAKGIETVRRDNCPLVGKILDKTLRLLFETKDLSVVKSYVQRQLNKVNHGRVPLSDFIFAKEFRGRSRYKPGAHIAALKIADQQLVRDPMCEPLTGDRVPYCVVYGAPKLPLYQLVKSPNELVRNPVLRINSYYYITKQVLPALNRVFSLIEGTNVFNWFKEIPVYSNNMAIQYNTSSVSSSSKKVQSLAQFVSTKTCVSCFENTSTVNCPLCEKCLKFSQHTVWKLSSDLKHQQQTISSLRSVCLTCTGHFNYSNCCERFDCDVFQKLLRTERVLCEQNEKFLNVINKL